MYKILLTVSISIMFSSLISAQTVIKEKVELNPGMVRTTDLQVPERGYTPCGPYIENTQPGHYWQVVWGGYWGPLDPYQQLFGRQGGLNGQNILYAYGPYDIKIIEGSQYCNFRHREKINSTYFMVDTQSTELDGKSALDLFGSGDTEQMDCVDRNEVQQYDIFYHYINEPEATVVYSIYSPALNRAIYLHTLIVKRPFYLKEKPGIIDLPLGEEENIFLPPVSNTCTGEDTSAWYRNYTCKGSWLSFAGGGLPDYVKFNASITNGQQYGTLRYTSSGAGYEGADLSGLNLSEYESLTFKANGIEPDSFDVVKIKISTTDNTIPEANVDLNIYPNIAYPLGVFFDAEKYLPGDTADIYLLKRTSQYPDFDPYNAEYTQFPSDQLFNVKIEKGREYGTILNPAASDTSYEFTGIRKGFKLIVSDTIDTDSALITVRVSTVLNNGGGIAASIKKDNNSVSGAKDLKQPGIASKKTASESISLKKNAMPAVKNNSRTNTKTEAVTESNGDEIFGIGWAFVERGETQILLGETEYFGVKQNKEDGRLKIEEIKANYGEEPEFGDAGDGWDWIKDNSIWGNNPVSVDTGKNYGKKMGVYWETDKPVWKYNYIKQIDKYHFTEQKVGDLPIGMIRLIGRYWTQDSTYVVTLKAKSNIGESASIKIKLIKPSKLLSNGQSSSYARTRDVRDSVVNIDSLCIYYGGIHGVPPQYIKGHIYQESGKDYFTFSDGKTEHCFAPSYRYEPYTSQIGKGVLNGMKKNPFYLTASANVNPPNHQHVKVIPYFSGDTITVWQIVAEHSQLLRDGSTDETRLYGVRTHSDTMNYGNYNAIQKKYHELFVETKSATIFDKIVKKTRGLTFAERADSTNKKMIVYLRDEFTDEVGTKGMKNMIAQTRIASSYGYFQAMYTTAISKKDNWKYPEDADHLPENLNENNVIFPMATRMEKQYLENGVKDKSKNNWDIGFEAALERYIFTSWNPNKEYPISVMYNANRFSPQK